MKDRTKKTQWLYISIIFPAIIVLVIVFFLISIDPGAKGSSSPKTPQMKKLAVKIGRLETEVSEKQDELIKLSKLYGNKTGEPHPVLKRLGLSDDERKIIEDKILNEKDASINSLLKDILEKNNEISGLKIEIAKYEASLPESYIATGEKTHYEIAMDFLIKEKKIEEERAARLVEETILFDPLIPGFRVWNFYSDDEYVTFVTQGSANISPAELRRAPEESRDDTGSSNIDEKNRLDAEINRLKLTKNQLESKIKILLDENQRMEKKLNELYKQNTEMERLLHSLLYMVDLEENLLKRGIIKGGFLGSSRLKEISPEYFDQRIDLRKGQVIEIHAGKFKLSKIKKIALHPRFYKRGVDYKVEIVENNQKAIVTILAVEKFRRDRIVISVE